MRLGRLASLAAVLILAGASNVASAANSSAVATRRALSTLIPSVNLNGASLADAIEFVRDVSGANLHVNWRALEAAGIGKDTPLNIRLRDVRMEKVLRTLLVEASPSVPLTFYSEEGVIEVTTAEIADQQMITRVYPVDDLLMEVPDFDNAPDFNLNSGGGTNGSSGRGGGSSGGGGRSGGGGSSGGGGGGLFGGGGGGGGAKTAEKTLTKTQRAEALVTMVRETVRPEIWRENGGMASIRYYNGNLIITAPRSVHEAIGGPVE